MVVSVAARRQACGGGNRLPTNAMMRTIPHQVALCVGLPVLDRRSTMPAIVARGRACKLAFLGAGQLQRSLKLRVRTAIEEEARTGQDRHVRRDTVSVEQSSIGLKARHRCKLQR